MHAEPVQLVAFRGRKDRFDAAVLYQGFQVCIGHIFLFIAECLEFFKNTLDFFRGQMVSERLQPVGDRVLAGVLAEHQVVGMDADRLRCEDLVGLLVGQNTVLMNAAFMGKGIAPDNGLVERSGLADDGIDGTAGAGDLRRVDPRLIRPYAGAGFDRHDDFFQSGVAAALTEAVDGAFNLTGAAGHAREGVCGGEAQVIVAVDGEDGFVTVGNLVSEILDQRLHFRGSCIAHRVGNVYGRGACPDGGVYDPYQKVPVAAGGILRRELHIGGVFRRMGGHGGSHLQDLIRCFFQLVLHMQRAGGQKQMNAGIDGMLHGFPGGVDVLDGGSGERGDRTVLYDRGNGLYALKVAGRGDGEAGLNDIDLQTLKAFSHLDLFFQVHRAARRLFSVAQGRVKNADAVVHGVCLPFG